MIGVYIHVPFCAQKCPYCDFYSTQWRIPTEEAYVEAIRRDLKKYAAQKPAADTLYFGGGTPSLIQPQSIAAMIDAVKANFDLSPDAEITLECNPCTVTEKRAAAWASAGINRVSLGMQSAHKAELKLLGRRHSPNMVAEAVTALRHAGIQNISLDIMMALPHQTVDQILATIDFAASLQVQHISAYLLQIEEGTPFAKSDEIRFCPDEDQAAEMYLSAVNCLESHGYKQYEISNFALPGFQSRHNNKYWNSVDYLGFGPAAHSFYQGKRFSYPPDLSAYLHGCETVSDPEESASDHTEYAMLRLRLSEGLYFDEYQKRGGDPQQLIRRCQKYEVAGLLSFDEHHVALNANGFLISNALIADIIL